jgi:hypothetical protein
MKWRPESRCKRHFCSLNAGIDSRILAANHESGEFGVFTAQRVVAPHFDSLQQLINRVIYVCTLQFDKDIHAVRFRQYPVTSDASTNNAFVNANLPYQSSGRIQKDRHRCVLSNSDADRSRCFNAFGVRRLLQ